MHLRQKQFNPSGIKWPTEVDMLLNKTQTQIQFGKSIANISLSKQMTYAKLNC